MADTCVRCGRAAVDERSPEYGAWDVTDDGTGTLVMLCPTCLAEEPIDEDAFAIADEIAQVVMDDEVDAAADES